MKFFLSIIFIMKLISTNCSVKSVQNSPSILNIYNKLVANSSNYSDTELQVLLRNKTVFCQNDCSNNGFCLDGKCYCVPEFFGDDCSKTNKKCVNNCSEKGECINGQCTCLNGYSGIDCSVSTKVS